MCLGQGFALFSKEWEELLRQGSPLEVFSNGKGVLRRHETEEGTSSCLPHCCFWICSCCIYASLLQNLGMIALWALAHLLYEVHYEYPSRGFILLPGVSQYARSQRSPFLCLTASWPQPLPDCGFVSISWPHKHCLYSGTFWGRSTSSVKER